MPLLRALLNSSDSQASFQTVANEGSGGKQAAPAWQLKDVDGKTVKLSDFKGKVVILDFWATWCPPCRKEIPSFVALQKKYADKGVTVVGVSLDEGGVETVKSFMKQNGINYPVVLGDQQIAMVEICASMRRATKFLLPSVGASGASQYAGLRVVLAKGADAP